MPCSLFYLHCKREIIGRMCLCKCRYLHDCKYSYNVIHEEIYYKFFIFYTLYICRYVVRKLSVTILWKYLKQIYVIWFISYFTLQLRSHKYFFFLLGNNIQQHHISFNYFLALIICNAILMQSDHYLTLK